MTKTHFRFVLWNHSEIGQKSLEDIMAIMGQQMRALGYSVDHVPGSAEFMGPRAGDIDCVNVVVEGFIDQYVKDIADARAKGARFLCLATEEPTPKGFNWGTQVEMIGRQDVFPKACPHFTDGILHLVPGQRITDWYGSHGCKAAYAELGYAPIMDRSIAADLEPPYDFGFYGTLSQRRLDILKTLLQRCGATEVRAIAAPDPHNKHRRIFVALEGRAITAYPQTNGFSQRFYLGAGGRQMVKTDRAAPTGWRTVARIRLVADFATQAERNAAMQEAKVILQVRKFEEMGLVSSCRCAMSVSLIGRPVIGEDHDRELSKPYDTIVHLSPSLDDFYRDAMNARYMWKSLRAFQLEKLKVTLPPEICIGEPLRKLGFEPPLLNAAA